MSKIEWTQKTWNPVIGCTPVSPGCLNCYAAGMAHRMRSMPQTPEYHDREVPGDTRKAIEIQRAEMVGYTEACRRKEPRTLRIAEINAGRAVFTGDVRCLPERLDQPLRWCNPTMVFVDSMSDLFHKAVPFEFIDKVFAVMALCPQHTFQVLTKRPERMAEYLNMWGRQHAIEKAAEDLFHRIDSRVKWRQVLDARGQWPLRNVWLGTSVEHQKATERVQHLLRCTAAVRFLSCEPLLWPLDLRRCEAEADRTIDAFTGRWSWRHRYPQTDGGIAEGKGNASIHWVIVGGESGAKARPCNVEWIRGIVEQCKGSGVPVFVKQLGAKAFDGHEEVCRFRSFDEWVNKARSWLGGVGTAGRHSPKFQGVCLDQLGRECRIGADFMRARDEGAFSVTAHPFMRLRDRKGGDPAEWPEDLNVREWPKAFTTEDTESTEERQVG